MKIAEVTLLKIVNVFLILAMLILFVLSPFFPEIYLYFFGGIMICLILLIISVIILKMR